MLVQSTLFIPWTAISHCDRQPSAFLYSPFDTSTILHITPPNTRLLIPGKLGQRIYNFWTQTIRQSLAPRLRKTTSSSSHQSPRLAALASQRMVAIRVENIVKCEPIHRGIGILPMIDESAPTVDLSIPAHTPHRDRESCTSPNRNTDHPHLLRRHTLPTSISAQTNE